MPGTRGALAEEVSPAHLSAPRARGCIRTRRGCGGEREALGEGMARTFLALPLPARYDLARLTKNGSRNRVSCRRYPNTSSNIVAIVELRHRLRLIRTIGSPGRNGAELLKEGKFRSLSPRRLYSLYNPVVFALRVFAEFIK